MRSTGTGTTGSGAPAGAADATCWVIRRTNVLSMRERSLTGKLQSRGLRRGSGVAQDDAPWRKGRDLPDPPAGAAGTRPSCSGSVPCRTGVRPPSPVGAGAASSGGLSNHPPPSSGGTGLLSIRRSEAAACALVACLSRVRAPASVSSLSACGRWKAHACRHACRPASLSPLQPRPEIPCPRDMFGQQISCDIAEGGVRVLPNWGRGYSRHWTYWKHQKAVRRPAKMPWIPSPDLQVIRCDVRFFAQWTPVIEGSGGRQCAPPVWCPHHCPSRRAVTRPRPSRHSSTPRSYIPWPRSASVPWSISTHSSSRPSQMC